MSWWTRDADHEVAPTLRAPARVIGPGDGDTAALRDESWQAAQTTLAVVWTPDLPGAAYSPPVVDPTDS